METRANHIWIGAITLVLLALVAGFVIWISRLSEGDQNQYDIFFKQSVAGLANGSQVSFAGVPVGQVNQIELWDKDPEFVRVRIKVKESVPILVGTTATIQGSFTGVSTITLDGARSGAPPISCETTACTEGVPIIPPTTGGGFGAVLASAPLLLERLATLTERLTVLLSDRNQEEISQILANTNAASAGFAAAAPQLERTMAELQVTLREASEALDQFEQVTASTDRIINQEGEAIAKDLRSTLKSASGAARALEDTLNEARPATKQLTESTLPAAEATLRDLRATSKALRDVTETIDEKGAGALLSSQPLPDYKP